MAAALAMAPKQEWGSPEAAATDPGGMPNQSAARSLQAKYPEIETSTESKSVNEVQIQNAPAEAPGFDRANSRELPELRTERDRTFLNPDGSHTTETGNDPIHYRDAAGTYQPIDTRVVPQEDGTGWRNAADSVRVELAAESTAPELAAVRVDSEHSVGFSVAEGAWSVGQVAGDSVTYPGVRPEADLRFDVVAGGLKEILILRSPAAPRSWIFPLRLAGLTATVIDGRVAFLDATGTERAHIPAGFMTDATSDPSTGDPATSYGVTYTLIDHHGQQALRVDLDSAWLDDRSRQYPVEVDPSIDTSKANTSIVVQGSGRSSGSNELRVGTTGGTKAASYLAFDGIQDRLRNHKIFGAYLSLVNSWSWSCKPRPVSVHAVTAPWGSSGGFPGPGFGPALTHSSFAHGYVGSGQSSSSCPPAAELIELGTGGRDLVQRWVNGEQANYGLTVRASETDPAGWKKFAGHGTKNPPRLYVTHSPYNAEYKVDRASPEPPVHRLQGGYVKMTVTNRGAQTWTPSTFAFGYRAYALDGAPVASVEAATLPHDVPRGASVTLDAFIKPLEPGDYLLDFSMLKRGGPWFTDEQIPPVRLMMKVIDVPPIVKGQYPPNGYSAQTLTPQLWVDAVDIDAPVNSTLKYRFEVCTDYVQNPDGTLSGVGCLNSGYVNKRTWTVPVGALKWSKDYQWRAFGYDGVSESQQLPPSHLLTAVPQPEITSHLGAAPFSGAQPDFDPQTGNYVTSAIDAPVVTTGPQLSVSRTYNSLDPRRDLAFGAGWSTQYDMRVIPDTDGSGNVVVSYPDGQQVRFGRNNDGSFSPPPGRQADFRTEVAENGGGWVLVDKSATLYRFRTDGRLISIHDEAGHWIELDYGTPEKLRRAISRTSGRTLYFTWSGNHVASVKTDPIDGQQLAWNYTYDGDKLTKVCDPDGGCTQYGQTIGSHYRTSVLDARPASYWRLGEAAGAKDATSQVGTKLTKDNGTYTDVTLGQPGPLTNAADTAATFNGTSSHITVPDGMVRKNRDLAIEMWFKTSQSGPLFGQQRAKWAETPTGALPVLYIGNDGKLRGQFWNGGVNPITTTAPVNDNQWHHVVLSGSLATQTMFVDGQPVGTIAGEIDHADMTYNQIGAAYTVPPEAWPAWGSAPRRFFSGQIDEVAFYEHPVGPTTALAHFQARVGADYLNSVTLPSGRTAAQLAYDTNADRLAEFVDRNGGQWKIGLPVFSGTEANPVRTTAVTDPGNRQHFYDYDPMRGRIVRYIAPLGLGLRQEDRKDSQGQPLPPPDNPCDPAPTPQPGDDPSHCGGPSNGGSEWVGGPVKGQGVRTYDYDAKGYPSVIGDELGNQVFFTNDERGNVTSRKTCRVAPGDCQTSYYTYYFNPDDVTDPRNDKQTSSRDARSSGPNDTTYATNYVYTGLGKRGLLESQTTPDGGVVRHRYTTGSEAAIGGGNMPEGLILETTDPRGGTARYAYYRNGDLARVTAPSGLVTNYTYDTLGRKIIETQSSDSYPGGLTTTYGYDKLSRRTVVTAPAAKDTLSGVTHTSRTLTDYDPDGNATRVEVGDLTGGDAARITTTEYDDRGRAHLVTNPEGGQAFYGYDSFGNTKWTVDPGGNKYEYGYTARNALAEVRLRSWHGQPVDPDAGNGGDGNGNGDADTAADLILGSYGYDLAGRLVRDTDAMGRTLRYHYYDDSLLWRTVADDVKDPHNPTAPVRDIVLSELNYDAAGNNTQETRPGGRITTYEYDTTGRRTAQTVDPAGLANRNQFTYHPSGDLTKVVHTGKSSNSTRLDLGRVETIEYGYDTAGRQTSTTVHNGGNQKLVTTQKYDQRGLRIATTDPRGNAPGANASAFTTNYTYDTLGRQTTITEPAVITETAGNAPVSIRPETVTGYNTFGEPTATRNPNGHISTFTQDRLGRVVEASSPEYRKPGDTTAAKAITRTTYDALGKPVAVTNPRGSITRQRYDQLGQLVERTDPDPANGAEPGGTWRYSYTRNGEPLSVTDPTGARAEATYDDLGRIATTTQLERYPTPAAHTTKLRYDDYGNLTSTTAPTGETTQHTYDALGQRLTSTDAAGVVTTFGYDLAGNQVRASDGKGRTTYRTFDPAGRNTGVLALDATERVLRKDSLAYDPAGNLTAVTDPLGRTTQFTHNTRNQVVEQREPVSATETITTTSGYDAAGQRTRFIDGRGNSTFTTYNTLGLPESVIEPATAAHPGLPERTWTTSYDLAGNAVAETAPGGVQRQRTFDTLDRLTHETGTGAAEPTADRTQRFDSTGRLLGVSAPTGEKTFTYNDRGSMLTSTGPLSGTSTYTYDGSGRLTQRADPTGTATFSYLKGQLKTAADGITATTQTLTYDTAGALTTTDYGAGRTRQYTYDEFGRQKTDTLTGTGGIPLASATYGYDLNDRLTSKNTTGTAEAGNNTYAYDHAGRLTSWTKDTTTTAYTWDAAGNRTSAGGVAATFDERNRQLTDGAATLTWSPRGTQQTRSGPEGTVNYGFDAFDRNTKHGQTTYQYDGLDRTSTRNGQELTYDGGGLNLIADGTSTFSRGTRGEVLSQKVGGDSQLTINDRHGDLVASLDPAASSITSSTSYDPFGRTTASSGTRSSLGFQGDYTDPDTGAVDMGARWYAPGTGTFNTRDTINLPTSPSNAANRYSYGANSPVNYADPDGHFAWLVVGLVGGALVGGGVWLYNEVKSKPAPPKPSPPPNYSYGQSCPQCHGGGKISPGPQGRGVKYLEPGGGYKPGKGTGKGPAIHPAVASQNAAKHNPMPVPAAAGHPVYSGSGGGTAVPPVSATPNLPAKQVGPSDVIDQSPGLDEMINKVTGDAPVVQNVTQEPVSDIGHSGTGTSTGTGKGGNGPPGDYTVWDFLGDLGHGILDVAGLVPVIGELADGINAAWYLAEGDHLNAALSAAAAIPFAGWLATAGKGVNKAVDAASAGAKTAPPPPKAPKSEPIPTAPVACKNSFVPGTAVLMADGSSRPIEQVNPGDQVHATDPVSGESGARVVTATIVGVGLKNLVELTIDTDPGPAVEAEKVVATEGHPFWLQNQRIWTRASDLSVGAVVQAVDGSPVEVVNLVRRTAHGRVYNLSVNNFHTYYVLVRQTAVLVHNCGSGEFFTVQGLADKARLMSGGHPFPIEPHKAHFGPGVYSWGSHADAYKYAANKPGAEILTFSIKNEDLMKFSQAHLAEMSDEVATKFMLDNSLLWDGKTAHGFEYISRPTGMGMEHFFAASIFEKLRFK